MTQDLFIEEKKEIAKFNYPVVKVLIDYQLDGAGVDVQTAETLVVVNDITIATYIAQVYINLGFLPQINGAYKINPKEVVVQEHVTIDEYVQALQRTITAHDTLYEQNQPIITDTMYDSLYHELVEMEGKYPHTRNNTSPTQRIITSMVETLEKVLHSRPMLSLGKTTTEEGLMKFLGQAYGESVIIQRKEDGLTVVGTYDKGLQADGVTRGNGETGERVLHSISQIENLPKVIDFKGHLELRFEVVVPYEDFERVNVNGEYSNPRNLASGSVRTLDGSLAKERGLKAYVIEIVEIEGMEFKFDTERIEFVKSLGFEISDTAVFFENTNVDQERETKRFLDYIFTYGENIRPTLDHMIDGLVIKFNRLSLREQLGETNKHPRWAIAFKFPSLDAITTCTDIVLQIGKTGAITPVCEFEMVEIGGTEIRRANLHNPIALKEKDIRVGDKILIQRAKDVIPHVVKSFHEQRTGEEFEFEIPPCCPVCGGTLEYKETDDGDGKLLYCIGKNCEPQIIGKLEHFVSRNAMNIDGLGEKTVAMLYKKGFIKNFEDIYSLEQYRSQIVAIDNFGDKKFDKMIKGIEDSKKQPLSNVLYSLSIELIGETASKEISKIYNSMDEILVAAKNPYKFKETILSIDTFGEKMTKSVVDYFTDKDNVEQIKRLLACGLTMQSSYKKPAADSKISGKVFVITGSLSKDRKLFKAEIESLGGKVTGSVSKNTNYLLMGDDAEGKTKHTAALKLGVEILSEEQYLKLVQ